MEYFHEIDSMGNQFYYEKGLWTRLHRATGPAAIYVNGDRAWWQHGELHRLDGPAIERADGSELFYIHGKLYSKSEFIQSTQT